MCTIKRFINKRIFIYYYKHKDVFQQVLNGKFINIEIDNNITTNDKY